MKPVLLVYSTRYGQTEHIAKHLRETLRSRGLDAKLQDARELHASIDLSQYAGVMVAASVIMGGHQREMVRFVEREREQLERMPTAFVSVSLAQATAENELLPQSKRREAANAVSAALNRFFASTRFRPDLFRAVAGAITYSKYNFLVRFMMKHIANREGASTDTSKDHEYTDWNALARFASEFADRLTSGAERPAIPPQL